MVLIQTTVYIQTVAPIQTPPQTCLGIRVVLRPESDKLPQVVEAEDGPVPSEIVKVVHDDSDEEVQDEEGADDEEADEVGVGEVGAAAPRVPRIIRLQAGVNNDYQGIIKGKATLSTS